MLVNFFIEPLAIDDNTNGYHVKALRSKWEQLGVLVHPSDADGSLSRLSDEFLKLNQETKGLWDDFWQEVENNPVRFLRCRENLKVALISERRARSEQIPNGDSKYVRGIEGIRLTEVNASKEFGQSEELTRKRIDIDDVIVDLWRERFQQLAKHAHEVVIVDEWAVRDNTSQGLAKFLDLLDGDANGCNLIVYSSPETELQDEVNAISNRIGNVTSQLSTHGISTVEVRLRPEDDFRLYAHERHIRFDNRVVGIGRGLRTFQYATVREATDTSLTLLPPNVREGKESDLDEKAYTLSDFCLIIGSANSP